MTNTPDRTSFGPADILRSQGMCEQCNGPIDAEDRCLTTTCFRYRPPDAKPIVDPPKLKRLVGADRESPASGGRFPEPPASPVTIDPADTTSRIEDAVEAAAGTVKVDPDIGQFKLEPYVRDEPDDDPVEPVEPENPKHAALRAVLMAIDDLPTEDARKVLAAADAQLELN